MNMERMRTLLTTANMRGVAPSNLYRFMTGEGMRFAGGEREMREAVEALPGPFGGFAYRYAGSQAWTHRGEEVNAPG